MDESKHSKLIAEKISSNHENIVADKIKIEDVDKILSTFDSPIFDSSIIPTHQICKHVSNQAKVFLGGDGGDELFGGYSNYQKFFKVKSIYALPLSIRKK